MSKWAGAGFPASSCTTAKVSRGIISSIQKGCTKAAPQTRTLWIRPIFLHPSGPSRPRKPFNNQFSIEGHRTQRSYSPGSVSFLVFRIPRFLSPVFGCPPPTGTCPSSSPNPKGVWKFPSTHTIRYDEAGSFANPLLLASTHALNLSIAGGFGQAARTGSQSDALAPRRANR